MKHLPLGLIVVAFLCVSNLVVSAAVGGGYTLGGLQGNYFATTNLSGSPAFARRDVRLDFTLNSLPPGGAGRAGDLAFRSVPATNFSVLWTGQLVPSFNETYSFATTARGSFSLRLRPGGSSSWSTVIDQPSDIGGSPSTGVFNLTAGQLYDVEVAFVHGQGPWAASLSWSSPSTPAETIDPLVQSGINNPDWTAGFTDIIKGARNSWEPNGGSRPATDTNGWPMGDGAYVFQESLNQGMDLDPLMRGRISFSFQGSATVSVQGNVQVGSLTAHYDAAQNLTTGSFIAASNGWNASYFKFANARRNGQAGGLTGLTHLRLMRPLAPGANSSYDPTNSLFTPQLLDALSHFTVVRHQLVANQQRDWSERTPPAYFNQSGGTMSAPHYGVGDPSNNGASWEHKILLANESGRDLMLSIPTVAYGRSPTDTASYLYALANLLRYGSDGNQPYTSSVDDPVYPPLNPNLRVYLELENELWNWASVFYTDWANINAVAAGDADTTNADFQAINFDHLPTTKDASGNYVSMNTWRFRKIILRLIQVSDIFRSVFGDAAMGSRIRPLYEWQYANANDTARLALTFADRYFNNGDGLPHVANPHPLGYWLWGGGGATYYGAVNGNGLTPLLSDPAFNSPALAQPGYQTAPAGGIWTFGSLAGIARDGGAADDIPPPFGGNQVGFVTDHGSLSVSLTFPTNFTSPIFGVSFKAVNRTQLGATNSDHENIRVYLDGTNDITARTFSQGNGCTPPGYDPAFPWSANNVFWTHSDYYFTRSFAVQPGSTHTLNFQGRGDLSNPANTNQTVFLGEVRVTSVDRIFQDGMPGGGEATGQPLGQNMQNTMNVEVAWAKAFGLEELSYESGWSLGGDDGGSWVQLKAKYGDTRTAGVQGRFMDMFYLAGSAVNVFGTYAQWPSWSDYYAEQGLLNVGQYPIVQGIDDRASHLRPEPANGVLVPAVLTPVTATLTDNANTLGQITAAGGWLSWNALAPRSGQYQLSLLPAGTNSAAVLLVDNAPLSGRLTGTVFMAKGLHSVKARSTSPLMFQVRQIIMSSVGGPGVPSLLSAVEGDGQVTLTWSASPGATGYQVRFGTSPGVYTQVTDAGSATSITINGLTNNQQYFFVVVAENAAGVSLPSVEKGVVPLASGQNGSLVIWEFSGFSGSESNAPPASASARLTITPLERGTGLSPSQSDWAAGMRANRFASEPSNAAGHSYGADLSQAIARNQYYQFTVQAAPDQSVSLSQMAFRAFFQNGAGGAGLTYSTDGTNFSPGILAAGSPSTSSTPWTVPLAAETTLQNTRAPITVRLYLFALGAYQVSALGDTSGSDIVLTGSLAAQQSALRINLFPPDNFLLSWPSAGVPTNLASSQTLISSSWEPVPDRPQLQTNRWFLILPHTTTSLFFRLVP